MSGFLGGLFRSPSEYREIQGPGFLEEYAACNNAGAFLEHTIMALEFGLRRGQAVGALVEPVLRRSFPNYHQQFMQNRAFLKQVGEDLNHAYLIRALIATLACHGQLATFFSAYRDQKGIITKYAPGSCVADQTAFEKVRSKMEHAQTTMGFSGESIYVQDYFYQPGGDQLSIDLGALMSPQQRYTTVDAPVNDILPSIESLILSQSNGFTTEQILQACDLMATYFKSAPNDTGRHKWLEVGPLLDCIMRVKEALCAYGAGDARPRRYLNAYQIAHLFARQLVCYPRLLYAVMLFKGGYITPRYSIFATLVRGQNAVGLILEPAQKSYVQAIGLKHYLEEHMAEMEENHVINLHQGLGAVDEFLDKKLRELIAQDTIVPYIELVHQQVSAQRSRLAELRLFYTLFRALMYEDGGLGQQIVQTLSGGMQLHASLVQFYKRCDDSAKLLQACAEGVQLEYERALVLFHNVFFSSDSLVFGRFVAFLTEQPPHGIVLLRRPRNVNLLRMVAAHTTVTCWRECDVNVIQKHIIELLLSEQSLLWNEAAFAGCKARVSVGDDAIGDASRQPPPYMGYIARSTTYGLGQLLDSGECPQSNQWKPQCGLISQQQFNEMVDTAVGVLQDRVLDHTAATHAIMRSVGDFVAAQQGSNDALDGYRIVQGMEHCVGNKEALWAQVACLVRFGQIKPYFLWLAGTISESPGAFLNNYYYQSSIFCLPSVANGVPDQFELSDDVSFIKPEYRHVLQNNLFSDAQDAHNATPQALSQPALDELLGVRQIGSVSEFLECCRKINALLGDKNLRTMVKSLIKNQKLKYHEQLDAFSKQLQIEGMAQQDEYIAIFRYVTALCMRNGDFGTLLRLHEQQFIDSGNNSMVQLAVHQFCPHLNIEVPLDSILGKCDDAQDGIQALMSSGTPSEIVSCIVTYFEPGYGGYLPFISIVQKIIRNAELDWVISESLQFGHVCSYINVIRHMLHVKGDFIIFLRFLLQMDRETMLTKAELQKKCNYGKKQLGLGGLSVLLRTIQDRQGCIIPFSHRIALYQAQKNCQCLVPANYEQDAVSRNNEDVRKAVHCAQTDYNMSCGQHMLFVFIELIYNLLCQDPTVFQQLRSIDSEELQGIITTISAERSPEEVNYLLTCSLILRQRSVAILQKLALVRAQMQHQYPLNLLYINGPFGLQYIIAALDKVSVGLEDTPLPELLNDYDMLQKMRQEHLINQFASQSPEAQSDALNRFGLSMEQVSREVHVVEYHPAGQVCQDTLFICTLFTQHIKDSKKIINLIMDILLQDCLAPKNDVICAVTNKTHSYLQLMPHFVQYAKNSGNMPAFQLIMSYIAQNQRYDILIQQIAEWAQQTRYACYYDSAIIRDSGLVSKLLQIARSQHLQTPSSLQADDKSADQQDREHEFSQTIQPETSLQVETDSYINEILDGMNLNAAIQNANIASDRPSVGEPYKFTSNDVDVQSSSSSTCQYEMLQEHRSIDGAVCTQTNNAESVLQLPVLYNYKKPAALRNPNQFTNLILDKNSISTVIEVYEPSTHDIFVYTVNQYCDLEATEVQDVAVRECGYEPHMAAFRQEEPSMCQSTELKCSLIGQGHIDRGERLFTVPQCELRVEPQMSHCGVCGEHIDKIDDYDFVANDASSPDGGAGRKEYHNLFCQYTSQPYCTRCIQGRLFTENALQQQHVCSLYISSYALQYVYQGWYSFTKSYGANKDILRDKYILSQYHDMVNLCGQLRRRMELLYNGQLDSVCVRDLWTTADLLSEKTFIPDIVALEAQQFAEFVSARKSANVARQYAANLQCVECCVPLKQKLQIAVAVVLYHINSCSFCRQNIVCSECGDRIEYDQLKILELGHLDTKQRTIRQCAVCLRPCHPSCATDICKHCKEACYGG